MVERDIPDAIGELAEQLCHLAGQVGILAQSTMRPGRDADEAREVKEYELVSEALHRIHAAALRLARDVGRARPE
jgi:hypothetical protein